MGETLSCALCWLRVRFVMQAKPLISPCHLGTLADRVSMLFLLGENMLSALLPEVSAQLVFLLFGQVGLHDLKLLAFDCLSHPAQHSPGFQQEQGRSAWGNLGAHLVDEVLIDAIVRKVPHQGTNRGTHRQAKERNKEQQAEEQPPECSTQCTSPGRDALGELLGFGLLGASRPTDDGPIMNLDQLLP